MNKKTIVVSKANFMDIHDKILKICTKRRMMERLDIIGPDGNKTTEHMMFMTKYELSSGETIRKFRIRSRIIIPTIYDGSSIKAYSYSVQRPLIHLSTATDCAIVLFDGTEIQFLPFGGFRIFDNSMMNYKLSDSIYVYTFRPDFFHKKIASFGDEIIKRDEETRSLDQYISGVESEISDYDDEYY